MPGELRIYSKTCLLKAGEGAPRMHGETHGKAFLATLRWKRCSLHIDKKNKKRMDGGWGRAREGVEGLSLQQQRGG